MTVVKCPICDATFKSDDHEADLDEVHCCMDPKEMMLHETCTTCALKPYNSQACKDWRKENGYKTFTTREMFGE